MDAAAAREPRAWLRPKGNLMRREVAMLVALASVPLLMMLLRVAALPGAFGPGSGGGILASWGQQLERVLSLSDVPAGDREGVLYMLFLPTGAMLIALARLTFGLRVIGFRSILISVGFQESGVVPSMILIGVVVAIVVVVRPTLIRIRLPYHARVSVIMSIAVVTLLAALLAAPWLRSETLWGVAFFPVIVLGLLAEGIAKTLDRANGLTAVWRTGMTIGIALLLAGIGQLPLLREIALRFPELVVTQIAAVVLISEFLDLRLFQDWDARLSATTVPRLLRDDDAMHVAVVRNKRGGGVIGRLGEPAPTGARRPARRIAAALRARGHTVQVLEGDTKLLSRLRDFMPAHARTGQPGGIVLNLAQGIQGELPATHVPSMLEMAGVPYTGPSPRGLLVTGDRLLTSAVLEHAGVATTRRWLVDATGAGPPLDFPLLVRPRRAGDEKARVVESRSALQEAARQLARDGTEAMAERPVAGRAVQVALLGNDRLERLPLLESGEDGARPLSLEPSLERAVRSLAVRAFGACSCRDHALITVRVAESGRIEVVEVRAHDLLRSGGAFRVAAETAGLDLGELVERIVAAARERYRPQAPVLTLVRDLEGARAAEESLVAR